MSSGRNKVDSSFSSSQSFPQLLSPIDKHLHLFGDGSKSRLQSPFERGSGLLHDGQLGYSSGSFMYSSNPSLPFSCGLSTDLFSTIPPQQEENQQTLPTNIEEFPTLQYLDLAKKDPFLGQNPGLSQINNTKDPFLINAAFKTTEKQNFGLQKSQITRSCEDLQSSPTLPLQDGNYFNFPSTLDEPTQLDYLDLATLDFITNPNLISYAPVNVKEKTYEKDQDIFSEDNITCHETNSVRSEAVARLGNTYLSDHGGSDGLSAFSRVKKKKKLRLKKSKSDIERRYENIMPQNRNSSILYQATKDVFVKHDLIENVSEHIQGKKVESLSENIDVRKSRKRRSDSPKGSKSESKLMKMNKKPEKHLNVRDKLTHLTEEQKDKMKAVLGQTGCIFVKKKRSLSCDEPVVYVNDSQVFSSTGLFRETSEERDYKFHPIKSNSRVIFDDQHKPRKLTSVLQLKCQECDFQCRSVLELKNHRAKHIKKPEEDLIELQNVKPSQVTVIPNLLHDKQHVTDKDKEDINEQRMGCHVNVSCHLEKIPEVTGVDEQANTGLFVADVRNTFTTSLSAPFISENSKQTICEGKVVKDIDDSSRKTSSSLPITETHVPIKPSKTKQVSVPLSSQPSSSLYLNPDLNQETEMAVKAIESISSEYDICNLNKEEMSSEYSDYIAVKTVLDCNTEANGVQALDNDLIYDKPGLDLHVLNMNPIAQDIKDNKQCLTEENETYSALKTVPLFQDKQTCSKKKYTEISRTDDKLPDHGEQDTEVTNEVFEDLLENGIQYSESCGTGTNTDVLEQAFVVEDSSAGVKMNIDNERSRIKDRTRETEHVENTLNNDLIDISFENLQVLVEPNVGNLQDLEESRVGTLQHLEATSVDTFQVSDERNTVINDDIENICNNIKESDMILEVCRDGEELKRKERDIQGNSNRCTDSIENLFPIPSVNSDESLARNDVDNEVYVEHSNNFEKFSQDISDPDVRTYLDKLVDLVSSDNFECTNKYQQDDLLENVKPASEFDIGTCESSNETNSSSVIIYNKNSDVLELNSFAKEAMKERSEVMNDQNCGYVTESLPNSSLITDSANISGHTLLENVLLANEFAQDISNNNKTETTQLGRCSDSDRSTLSISVASDEKESDESVTVDTSISRTNVPMKVDSINDRTNVPMKDKSSYININTPKVSCSKNNSTNELKLVDFNNDISGPVNINVENDSININIPVIDNTGEIERKTPENSDVIHHGDDISVMGNASHIESDEPKLDDTGDIDRNVPVIVDIQYVTEMCSQLANNEGLTTGVESSKIFENENNKNALKSSAIHKMQVPKVCSAVVDQNKKSSVTKEHFIPNSLSKVVQGKGYKKQVKECGMFKFPITMSNSFSTVL